MKQPSREREPRLSSFARWGLWAILLCSIGPACTDGGGPDGGGGDLGATRDLPASVDLWSAIDLFAGLDQSPLGDLRTGRDLGRHHDMIPGADLSGDAASSRRRRRRCATCGTPG